MKCYSCPRMCGADRKKEKGYCRMPDEFVVARAGLHFWEEPPISGKNGSGTVFFSGCNLGCVYCQNYEISHENTGKTISDERLLEIFGELKDKGAHNINLVNPTHYAERLATLLPKFGKRLPIVYNSSGYERAEILKTLEGEVDIYLPDLKYINPDKSRKYSSAENYVGERGDVVFFDTDADGKADRTGIVIYRSDNLLMVIEGDVDLYGDYYQYLNNEFYFHKVLVKLLFVH